tara:strand:- start:16890 stop:17120 length:231 start_codon:yes stop_codon:yes gene_type:complete
MKHHKYSGKRRAPPITDPTASFREGLSGIISKRNAKSHKGALLAYRDITRHCGGAVVYSVSQGCFTHARSWVRKDP